MKKAFIGANIVTEIGETPIIQTHLFGETELKNSFNLEIIQSNIIFVVKTERVNDPLF